MTHQAQDDLPTAFLPTPVATVRLKVGEREYPVRIAQGEAWLVREIFEGHEYGGIPGAFLRDNMVVLDVGANVGLFALYVKLCYRASAVVHCFEPAAANFQLLTENLAAWAGIEKYPFALGSRNGEATLFLHQNNSAANSLKYATPEQFPFSTQVVLRDAGQVFDSLGVVNVDLLKLDTEGCELDILESLGPRLRRIRFVFAEFHSRTDRRRMDALLGEFELFDCRQQSVDQGLVKYVRANLIPPPRQVPI